MPAGSTPEQDAADAERMGLFDSFWCSHVRMNEFLHDIGVPASECDSDSDCDESEPVSESDFCESDSD